MPDSNLKDRTALVTGAGRGLGRAMSLALAEAGASVVLTSRTAEELEATAEDVAVFGGGVETVVADIGDPDDVHRLYERAITLTGAVDIVINNAGNMLFRPLIKLPGFTLDEPGFDDGTSYDAWREVLRVHLDGAFHVLREFGPGMLERRWGRVINIASSALGRAVPFTSAYDTAKAALAQLTQSLAFEWARYGVTVNAVAAGQFHTKLSAAMHETEAGQKMLRQRIPMRRVGVAEELGALVTFLASDQAAFMTGQIIGLDGGETL
jgi:NAD(P)-dependent dehydrogenase (short-subunit alcohol dehydrogenase family)